MPVKDITPTQEEREAQLGAGGTVAEDIHKRWHVWNELAKNEMGKFSSPYMLIASALLSQGMMAMLCAQVPEALVAKNVEQLFDVFTDPDAMQSIFALREDKKEILAYCDKLLRAQRDGLAARRVAN